MPVGLIGARAREVGARFLLDACQSVPHMAVDVQQLGADFVVASSHKMLGPTGVGFLYAPLDLLRSMPPFLGGRSHLPPMHPPPRLPLLYLPWVSTMVPGCKDCASGSPCVPRPAFINCLMHQCPSSHLPHSALHCTHGLCCVLSKGCVHAVRLDLASLPLLFGIAVGSGPDCLCLPAEKA